MVPLVSRFEILYKINVYCIVLLPVIISFVLLYVVYDNLFEHF